MTYTPYLHTYIHPYIHSVIHSYIHSFIQIYTHTYICNLCFLPLGSSRLLSEHFSLFLSHVCLHPMVPASLCAYRRSFPLLHTHPHHIPNDDLPSHSSFLISLAILWRLRSARSSCVERQKWLRIWPPNVST